ncbi:MAG: M48 family metalloprotease [Proteobacteria bacterium]|nr:M48 family metalloprotease [Pseudomonadota bacterium]
MFAAEWTNSLLLALWVASFVYVLWLMCLGGQQSDSVRRIGMTAEKDPPFVSVRDIVRAFRALRTVCDRAQIPCPKMQIARNMIINAYANPSLIMLTVGIIRHLTDDELEALIAHELAHILHEDSSRLNPSRCLEGWGFALSILGMIFMGVGFVCMLSAYRDDAVMLAATKVAMFWSMAVLIVVSVVARLWARHRSRCIEYEADATAAFLTSSGAVTRMLTKVCVYKRRWSVSTGLIKSMWQDVDGNLLFMILACLISALALIVGILERTYVALMYIPYRLHVTHPPGERRIQALG